MNYMNYANINLYIMLCISSMIIEKYFFDKESYILKKKKCHSLLLHTCMYRKRLLFYSSIIKYKNFELILWLLNDIFILIIRHPSV